MGIGSQLKKARESCKFSQQEVGDLLNVSQKTISNIESEKSLPTVVQLALLGKLYNLEILQLLSDQGITFKKKDSGEGENVLGFQYLLELKNLYEQRIKDKDSYIALLEEFNRKLKEELDQVRRSKIK